jgi:hypothetical protein
VVTARRRHDGVTCGTFFSCGALTGAGRYGKVRQREEGN